ncbi:hypothetical protein, partial [Bacillus sp. AFS001701]|uniref:hypothetical protein n=1 Tax=Bacillus sp. AFS001701 TaxID=2033480 RepID=UPI001596C0D9
MINYSQEIENPDILRKRIKSFTDITVALASKNKITLTQIFELLSKASRNILIKYPIYLEKISQYIGATKVEFLNSKEKTASEYYLKEIELPIILDVNRNMQYICWLYMFEDDNYTYGSLKDSFDKVISLKDINELLISLKDIEG